MRTPAALPYLLPPDEAVTVEPWRTTEGIEIGDRLEHWDPFTDLELLRKVTVDVDAVRVACGLGADSALALSGQWRSDRTRLAGEGEPVELGSLGGCLRAPVVVTVPGASAGGRLELQVRLLLRSAGLTPSAISPRRVGAVLWTDMQHVALEGGAARFPVTAADFAAMPRFPASGSWALEWSSEELEAPVLGGLQLLVNSGDPSLLEALRSGSGDACAAMVRSFVTFDVARSLVHGALANERFVEAPDAYDDGTVGRMLAELLGACWPGIPVSTLRARLIEHPSRLDVELQAHLGLVG